MVNPENKSPSRTRSRSRSPTHRQEKHQRSRSPRKSSKQGGFRWKDSKRPPSPRDDTRSVDVEPRGEKKKEKKDKKPTASTVTAEEPMIIVNVNDRLGTKTSVPCLASDPISTSRGLLASVQYLKKILLRLSYRIVQSPSGGTDRARTSRNHVEAARGTAFSRSLDIGGLWHQQWSTTRSVSFFLDESQLYKAHVLLGRWILAIEF